MTAGQGAALAPEELQSVRATLRSPRRLKTEVLAGLVVALALIPEAIAFSIIAGVDPRVGLFAAFTMAVTISLVGGRPAMISAATGAVALVIGPLVRSHGVDYLIATVILGGLFQVVLGLCGVAKLMRFVPRSVMVGFVNALAILIFMAQVPELLGVSWLVYPLLALGLAIVFGLPKLTTAVPAPLVAIVTLTLITVLAAVAVPTVGDKGQLPHNLPSPALPNVPFDLETLKIIFPFALAMAFVGLLESLMTAKLVDDITDTRSDKSREAWGQGVANIVTGFFGGMGGCAMIGQTMINVRASGGRTRISTFLAGGVPAGPGRRPGERGFADSDGGAGCGDDLCLRRHLRLAQRAALYAADDAQERDRRHGRDGHCGCGHQQPGHRGRRGGAGCHGPLRPPGGPLCHR